MGVICIFMRYFFDIICSPSLGSVAKVFPGLDKPYVVSPTSRGKKIKEISHEYVNFSFMTGAWSAVKEFTVHWFSALLGVCSTPKSDNQFCPSWGISLNYIKDFAMPTALFPQKPSDIQA